MEEFDDVAAKKIDALLRIISEVDNFGADVDLLSPEELDAVTGGVAVPDYQKFLRYIQERAIKDQEDE